MKSLTELRKENLEVLVQFIELDMALLEEQPNQTIVYDVDMFGEDTIPRTRTDVLGSIGWAFERIEEEKKEFVEDSKTLTEDFEKTHFDTIQNILEEVSLLKQELKTLQ